MRRRNPRPVFEALRMERAKWQPAGGLPTVQTHWGAVVGPQVAAMCQPISLRNHVLTVRCESAIVAQELEYQQPKFLALLTELDGVEVSRLRFVTGTV